MKMNKILSLVVFVLFTITSTVSAQQDSVSQKVYDLLESKRYKIEVNRMNPMKGSSRHLNTDYSITQSGDSIKSYLPYQGEAYSAPYGGGSVLVFDALITDYTIKSEKKGATSISFKARTPEDIYTYRIKVFKNGSSTIHVSANKRQSISFYGDLMLEEE
jgi:hypothetical protein